MSKPIPPAPSGWNKTIADLFAEMQRGERESVGSPEVDWAREYERSQTPSEMRFPRKGDVYEALEGMSVGYLTSWAGPYSGGGDGLLQKGDRVVIDTAPSESRAVSTYASAVDYKELERRIVPATERNARGYTGFYFSISTLDLNRKFRLVHEERG